MSYVHTKFDGICTDMKSETIKVFFPYIYSECDLIIICKIISHLNIEFSPESYWMSWQKCPNRGQSTPFFEIDMSNISEAG